MKKEFVKVLILRTIGNFLLLTALFFIGKTFYEPVRQEIRYFLEKTVGKRYVVSQPIKTALPPPVQGEPNLLASVLRIRSVEILTPENPNFSIVIPKIGANARIIPNVDPADEAVYLPALQKGVAQAAGTAFPGEGGHIFLFAHSTDYFWNVGNYNAVFYLLSKLEIGDEVNLFYRNQRFVYRIIGRQIVEPSQVEYLTRKSNREFLTLQTCWPAGTTLRRLLVFAVRTAE